MNTHLARLRRFAVWLAAGACACAGLQVTVERPLRLPHDTRVHSLAATADGRVLVGGASDGKLVYWSCDEEARFAPLLVVRAHEQPVLAIACSADGKWVASGDSSGVLRVWRTAAKELAWEARRHAGAIEDARFTADGTLITAGHDRSVRWWDVATGAMVREVQHEAQVYSIAIAADGATLFTGGDDPGLRIWRLPTGEPLQFVRAIANQYSTLACSAQGRLVAGGSTLLVFAQNDIPGSARRLRDRIHHGWIQSVAFAPDGNRFASGGDDGVARVWHAASGAEERTWPGHAGGVAAVVFLDDGRVVAAADDRGVLLHRL